jgi:hypothetical protein
MSNMTTNHKDHGPSALAVDTETHKNHNKF